MQAGTDNGGTTGPTARQDPGLPAVFGRYLLVQRLSRGGMGEIFLAKHGLAGFEKLAVIKKVLPHLAADQQFISRFVDEAQVAIKLQHVNVAQVFEVGRVGEEYFLALEYVEGRDLRRTLALLGHRRTRMPVDLALFIGRELANGLAYAHRRVGPDGSSLNLVHCDISPPNVLVSFEGETKVIDFGIAKSAIRGTATDPKMGFGKFGYMAPEQLIRGGVVDHRTDIYAAGVVLYELLTGMRLYEAGPEPDYRALAKKVAKGEHPLPSECHPSLALYDDLVATALRPRSEDRYQSAAEYRDAIQQALVNVNPTISTDQLGSYMRDLFQEEMTGQRELHDRVARAHLKDFQEQMHTQTISTVSFAMAQLPLQAPPEPAAPARARATGQRKAIPAPTGSTPPSSPTPTPGSLPPPVATVPGASMDELALADGTGTSVREPPRKSRAVIILGAAAALAVAAVVAYAMTRGAKSDAAPEPAAKVAAGGPALAPPAPPVPPPAAQQTAATNPATTQEPAGAGSNKGITFEPIDKPDQAPDQPKQQVKAVTQAPTSTQQKKRNQRVALAPKKEPKEQAPAKNQLTHDAVASKFSAMSRKYEAYKTKNGMQLDREWNELVTFVQYKMSAQNYDDAARRIDAFAAKLRE